MDINQLTAQKLRSLREEEGKSRDELSSILGLSIDQIGRIENGKIEITLQHLSLYSDHFHIPVPELVGQKSSQISHWHQPKGVIQNGNGNTLHCQLTPEIMTKLMKLIEDTQ